MQVSFSDAKLTETDRVAMRGQKSPPGFHHYQEQNLPLKTNTKNLLTLHTHLTQHEDNQPYAHMSTVRSL